MSKRWLWIAITLLTTVSVIAQEATCTELQQQAFDSIEEYCADAPDDMICYGNPTVSMNYNDTVAEDDDTLRFALSGDVVLLTAIDWFSTSSEANTWGIVDAEVRAYTEDSLHIQTSNMIVFGDVIVHNKGTENITLPIFDMSIQIKEGANVRAEPSSDAAIVGQLIQFAPLKVSGRTADNQWIRIHPSQDEVAWVSITVAGNLNDDLPVVEPDDDVDPLILPLQSFDFESGLPMSNCDGAGLSGILLQTYPVESPPVYTINDVTMTLDGTVFLQARPDTGFLVHVLEGSATITALDESLVVNEGYVSRIFMELNDDGRLEPIEAPGIPLVYDYQSLLSLPLDLLADGTSLGLDIYTLVTPRPISGESPIAGMALDASCKFTVGQSGANIRSAPSPQASIIAVMGYRESATPIARAIGSDGLPWWQLAEAVWIRLDTTVTGGDCTTVPLIQFEQ